MRVLGCTYHTPDFVSLFLHKKLKVPESDILFVGPGDNLPSRTNKSHIIFLRRLSLRRNIDVVNSSAYNGKTGVVFDDPLSLYDFEGVIPLDYSESINPHLDAFELDSIDRKLLKGEDVSVVFSPKKYVDTVQSKVESFTGILTQFMTFVYTTPRSSHQTPIKELACTWLCSDDDENVLRNKLASLVKGSPLNDRQQKRFLTLVTSPAAKIYKKALSEAKHLESYDCEEFTAIAAKYAVSAYEMRYMLSINSTASKRSNCK